MSVHKYSKLFGCNVHDSIRVSPLALCIINTPEFQRLKNIKQLGLCSMVFSSATHTRFEHSIGVYYLAGKMLEKIQNLYPDIEYDIPELSSKKIKLTEKIIECIKIAGLCHDIGHGPFSHIFDDVLLGNIDHFNKHHEQRSCLITEIICQRELMNELSVQEIKFIQSIINPSVHNNGVIYQIISNEFNGIDVDKFDYLARDSKNLGIGIEFNANRLINEFIIDNNGNIAYPKHCSSDIYKLFHSRYIMHKTVYTHKTVKLLEMMLKDIFILIDPIFKISDNIKNMQDFCKLTDNSIFEMLNITINTPSYFKINLTNEQYTIINKANTIYQNIISRKLYKQIMELSEEENGFERLCKIIDYLMIKYPEFDKNNFGIFKTVRGFVSGSKKNPFEDIYFYDKKEENTTFTIDKSHFSGLLNNKIQEIYWHLYCKDIYSFKKCMEIHNELKKII
ncbi:putative HD domain-containing protein [Cotonvirus japonicus]|uniref:HD domain-containing protein n=1 Tax=Cotonvirus japonicus TaxID=2811091 RepID=A0ABM7NSL8_9VIRU|nr:putative HD domain-containing protein [Cotonvirus japonicus]BCS83165.1 putative HD domain-containing protein [Cotonvirus japonicus]